MDNRKTIGILGGVGPLASAKFLETLYKVQSAFLQTEQEFTKVILYSNPSIPDRTEYLLNGQKGELYDYLLAGIKNLLSMDVDSIIVCCFTLHYLFNDLPSTFRNKIISLTNIVLQQINLIRKPALLLCTQGTYELGIFELDPLWQNASEFVVKPAFNDQKLIHKIIYQMKMNPAFQFPEDLLKQLMKKYNVDFCIAGCTEFHIYTAQQLFKQICKPASFIDPLICFAELLCEQFKLTHCAVE